VGYRSYPGAIQALAITGSDMNYNYNRKFHTLGHHSALLYTPMRRPRFILQAVFEYCRAHAARTARMPLNRSTCHACSMPVPTDGTHAGPCYTHDSGEPGACRAALNLGLTRLLTHSGFTRGLVDTYTPLYPRGSGPVWDE